MPVGEQLDLIAQMEGSRVRAPGSVVLRSNEPRKVTPPRISSQAREAARRRNIDPFPFFATPDHPGYNLSPKRVLRIFRESEAGYLRELADLYHDLLESDGHLRSLYEGRISGVASKNRSIQAGGADAASVRAAELLESFLEEQEVDFNEFIEHQLSTPFIGWAGTEFNWHFSDTERVWYPTEFDNVQPRRFRFKQGERALRLDVPQTQVETHGVDLIPDKWCVSLASHPNIARGGLLRTATWWALFKRLSMRDWVIFAERFGIPHAVGYYGDDTTQEARDVLQQALKDMGEGGYALLHEATRIAFADVAQRDGDVSSVHPAIIAHCDAEISKLFLGSTLPIDTGGPGSFALGKVHENRSFVLERNDAAKLARTFRRCIAQPFMRLNKLAGKPPVLNIQIVPELDPKTMVECADLLVNNLGIEIDGRHIADRLGLRAPVRDEDAAKPMAREAEQSSDDETESEVEE